MKMDIENGLLLAVTRSEDSDLFERINRLGVKDSDFDADEHRKAFRFIAEHFHDHGTVPAKRLVEDVCRIGLEDFEAEASFVVEEFLKRKMFRQVASAVDGVGNMLSANDPMAALERMRSFVQGFDVVTKDSMPSRVFDLGGDVVQMIEKIKSGYMGVELPWPTLTEITNGLWPGTATYCLARPGTGKTYVAVISTRHHWKNGGRPLFISPEMSKLELAERFFVVESGISSVNVIRGEVTDFEMKKLKDAIESTRGGDLFIHDYDGRD
jgi:replicative DNA helicase